MNLLFMGFEFQALVALSQSVNVDTLLNNLLAHCEVEKYDNNSRGPITVRFLLSLPLYLSHILLSLHFYFYLYLKQNLMFFV